MSPVPGGARTWLAGALCALAVSASLLSLTGAVAPGRWLPVGAAAVIALAALLAVLRSTTTAWWAPTLVGGLAVGLGLLAAYASPPGRFQPVPSTASLARLGDTFRAGLAYTDMSRPPVEAIPALELLIVGGALLVLLVVDLLALGLGAPAWSGLALLALWLPGITLGRPGSGLAFVGAAAAYVLLLALTAAPPPGSRGSRRSSDGPRRAGLAAAGAATVTVGALALSPLAGSLPGFATLSLPSLGAVSTGSLQLAQDLDLRESLGARSSEVVLTYRADPVGVGPLRVFTLRDFDGENWSRDTRTAGVAADDALLWPARDLADRPAGEAQPTTTSVDVTIRGLREERLPVPVMPRTLDSAGRWTYDAERDEVNRPSVTRPGMSYTMEVELLDLTADGLRGADVTYPADLDQYLEVPRTSHSDDVAAAAAEIASAADGTYEQALALQSYLRSAQNFTYDTEVPPARSDDAVWDFLQSRTGYCVQFGTAMTLLARTLGIPARLGVGFLPGTADDTGTQVVTGRDSHAWPELYFPGAGWVRFEPTPAVQSGSPPRWADPFASTGNAPVPEPNPRDEGAVPSAAPSQAPQAGPASAAADSDRPLRIAAGAAGSLMFLVGLGWWWRRRRSAAAVGLDPEVAWTRLRGRLAAAGITWSDARTPRQAAVLIVSELERRIDGPLGPEAGAALNALVRALEETRYAPAPRPLEHGELEDYVRAIVRELARSTRSSERVG
ncbi:transglutaminase family protein [Pengzhenrongella sicca]|uniref:Transglutaminase domain-containing protein n=1 Tax=Pengzhenrongella sicca TaxID=2819238 RepID=A0A8A4ZI46_9MICO|nr:transglutaminase domain-containing protein [Pengzhenrongella sicca]QTE30649.1 transglutaminase domain-containing protein [Pengzhenrongella sicca]